MMRPSAVDLFRRLVAFDTTSRNSNLPLAEHLADHLDRPGIRIEWNRSADRGKANLVVSAGPASEDRTGLVLSGHMDVVPAGEGWRSDPFALTRDGDTWAARGACDMKGFLALAADRMTLLTPDRLRAPLVLLFTYDEEVGTVGARRLAQTWDEPGRLPRRAIIGEPTSLRPGRMHKGHLRLKLTFRGKSAHSGYPHLGVNAIELGGRAIAALAELRATLEAERPPLGEHFPDVPYVALNQGQVAGGVATNVVPDCCTLDLGVRLLPGMPSSDLIARVREGVGAALQGRPFELEVTGESPPMALHAGADHFQALAAETGVADAPGVSFATDAGWLQSLGLECVIWGPGSIEVAHQPNEFVPIAQLVEADRILDLLVRRFCLQAEAT
ncbi:MAG: acetylornithine deacetylase [Gemmatimonadales bacterium]